MKKGFTLAEILITLGIIGVVAALAAPGLNSAIQKSKVGPSLAKFKSTMENGIEQMLADENSDSITANHKNQANFAEALSKYVKFSKSAYGSTIYNYKGDSELSIGTPIATGIFAVTDYMTGNDGYTTPDNVTCWFHIAESDPADFKNNLAVAGSALVDINGAAKPNRLGKDVFGFFILEDGTLIPFGGSNEFCNAGSDYTYCTSFDKYNWKNGTSGKCDDKTITGANSAIGMNCTGSIFENGLKVIYKY